MGAIAAPADQQQQGNGTTSQQQQPQTQQAPNPTATTTPITIAQFQLWKQRKDAEEAAKSAEAARKRAEDIAAGRVRMTGRELYAHDPSLFDDSRFE